MPRLLTSQEKFRIISLREEGHSLTEIARITGASRRTVFRVWQHYLRTGDTEYKQYDRRHRRTVLSATDNEKIVNLISQEPNLTIAHVRLKLNLQASYSTVRKRMREIVAPSIKLTNKSAKAPVLEDELTYLASTMVDKANDEDWWSRVVFSDEKTFSTLNLYGSSDMEPEDSSDEDAIMQGDKKSGRSYVNMLGFIVGDGDGILREIPTGFSQDDYIDVLKSTVVPFLRKKFPEPQDIVYVHDKCIAHQGDKVKTYFQSVSHFHVIELPSESTDRNPMGDVWKSVASRVDRMPAYTREELLGDVHNAFKETMQDPQYIRRLIRSMLDRLRHLVIMDGNWEGHLAQMFPCDNLELPEIDLDGTMDFEVS